MTDKVKEFRKWAKLSRKQHKRERKDFDSEDQMISDMAWKLEELGLLKEELEND